jgi:hypothetical protein
MHPKRISPRGIYNQGQSYLGFLEGTLIFRLALLHQLPDILQIKINLLKIKKFGTGFKIMQQRFNLKGNNYYCEL